MNAARPPAGPVRSMLVPKPGGGSRRLVRLSRDDDVRFRGLVEPFATPVDRSLRPSVIAGRLMPGTGRAALAPWRPAHRRWRRLLDRTLAERRVVVATDVAECYGSISPEAVGRALERVGASGEPVRRLVGWLHALEPFGVTGLPIGPEPSAILANAVLSAGDRALAATGVRWLRWVDDWVIVAESRSEAERALAGLAAALERDGLLLHEVKTHRWSDGRDVLREPGLARGSGTGAAAPATMPAVAHGPPPSATPGRGPGAWAGGEGVA
jgi:hypothetical protein